MSDAQQGQTQAAMTDPAAVTEFLATTTTTLTQLKAELDTAVAASDRVKEEGDDRINAVIKEVAEVHGEALAEEDVYREAYNEALDEAIKAKILAPEMFKTMGYTAAPKRPGRKPNKKK